MGKMLVDRLLPGAAAMLFSSVLYGAENVEFEVPGIRDHSSIWWAEGFPGVVEGAPWHRVIETGRYAMVLDTQKMTIPHFGELDGKEWKSLPPAELALEISVNGRDYRCTGSEGASRHGGPRLVEAGRIFQRADVTDLIFRTEEGEKLEVEARFETVAWGDRLGLIFEARPGLAPIMKDEDSFGKVGGGFGLDGTNDLTIQEASQLDPNSFTLSFWAFVPEGYDSATKTYPWLMTQGRNEAADGNVGIMMARGKAMATMNVGGGRDNQVTATSGKLRVGKWNHFLLSYDGKDMKFHLNGDKAEGGRVGKKRPRSKDAMIFGRRGDGTGDGYHFVGVIDEVQIFEGVVGPGSLGGKKALHKRSFRVNGLGLESQPRTPWKNSYLTIGLTEGGKSTERSTSASRKVSVMISPENILKALPEESKIEISAGDCPVHYEADLGWHRVNLDEVKPIGKGNDVIERIPLALSNPTGTEMVACLMFEKTGRGFRGRLGSAITGVTAILCDEAGEPTGIPVQLSKNWHNEAAAGVYKGTWFHGITQVRLPAAAKVKLQLVIANAHWGGVAAASHAQLSLIGWGSNQRWEQSALGCWGESICYEPSQAQANSTITDVRPLMVTPMKGSGQWNWTHNVGGGDFLRMFDTEGKRLPHQSMRTVVHRQGPCLTEVEFSGRIGEAIKHSVTTSLARTDDLVRGCYRVRMDVSRPMDVSRFVIFQVGADTYNFTREKWFVFGNESGVTLKKVAEPGGKAYRMKPVVMKGNVPWVSLEEGSPGDKKHEAGAWANRGIVIREWKARLGGESVGPHIAEHGMSRHGSDYSTMDLVPPPGVTRLESGDFVEAVIEYIVMPQGVGDYYGPNKALRTALAKDGGTWKMIHREAVENDREVEVTRGKLMRTFPDVRIECEGDKASFKIMRGLGYVPVTFTRLSRHDDFVLKVDGAVVDQSVHGNDFWQTDYDPATESWSRTYNLPRDGKGSALVEFGLK